MDGPNIAYSCKKPRKTLKIKKEADLNSCSYMFNGLISIFHLLETQISRPKQRTFDLMGEKDSKPQHPKGHGRQLCKIGKRGIFTLAVDTKGCHMLAEHGPAMYHGCWIKIHKDLGVLGFLSVYVIRV